MDIGQEGGCLQLYGGGGGCPVPRDRYLLADGWMDGDTRKPIAQIHTKHHNRDWKGQEIEI